MKLKVLVLALVIALLTSLSAVFAQEETIVDIAVGNEDFSTLVELVVAAGLADVLASEGPFTVFAPTNDAFAALPSFVVDYLLNNPEALTRVLTYHVIPGRVMSSDVSTMMAGTVEGEELSFVVTAEGVLVNGADIIAVDIEASNGVIHVINQVLIPSFQLPSVDPLAVTENIIAAGSSTVFPLTERMADLFEQDGFAGTITVDSIGSGAGFERFCVNAETDISNASRPIRPAEIESCRANGLEPVEFYIAIDALAVAVSRENDFVFDLTEEQVAQIFSGGTAITWADIDPSWPAEPIQLFSPGTDSGTFDYFVEEIFNRDQQPILDAPGIQLSEDDNVLVAGVEGSPFAIGYFGYAYYQADQDKMRAVRINGVEPNELTGASGEYPLARPLFIYSAPSVMQAKSQVTAFINYYLANANEQLGARADQIGYIPVPFFVQNRNALFFLAATGF